MMKKQYFCNYLYFYNLSLPLTEKRGKTNVSLLRRISFAYKHTALHSFTCSNHCIVRAFGLQIAFTQFALRKPHDLISGLPK